MLNDEQREALCSADFIRFAEVLHEIVAMLRSQHPSLQVLNCTFASLAASSLSQAEQSRRALIVTRKVRPETIATSSELEHLAKLPHHLKNAIAAALPAAAIIWLYAQDDQKRKGDLPTQVRSPAPPSCASPLKGAEQALSASVSAESPSAAVILLSALDNQESNRALLHAAKIPSYRVTNLANLDTYLSSDKDICGFVIDGSMWAGRDSKEQEDLLASVAEYSSFCCMLVDRTNFHDASRIGAIVSRTRPRQPSFTELVLREESSRLHEADLVCFSAAARLISVESRPSFIPTDLSESEILTLVATATSFYGRECNFSAAPLLRLGFKEVAGGKSPSRILLLTFNGEAMPAIAKVGERTVILDEVERFSNYVRQCDNHLRPFVQFHCQVGVIIFGIVEDALNPFRLAPTLESKLQDIWSYEVWPVERNPLCEQRLERDCMGVQSIVQRACRKLTSLNIRDCTSPVHTSYAYLRGSSLGNMLDSGMRWNLQHDGEKSIKECIEAAHNLLEPNKLKATVHGDIHLRNILARDSGDAYLIDYACSGPGHPAYDLARLECCMYFQFLRQVDSEESFVRLQKAISLDLAVTENLKLEFVDWYSSAINQTLLHCAVICRDACLEVLSHYGLGQDDYIAAKFILCCYSVSVSTLQGALTRGAIRALAAAF